jgi:phenylalanine ammonia-lyase
LIDPDTGIVHHGGNFQAMAVTMALEPLRLSLHHVGKILFAQSTELCNSSMNNGLGANLAGSFTFLNSIFIWLTMYCIVDVSHGSFPELLRQGY